MMLQEVVLVLDMPAKELAGRGFDMLLASNQEEQLAKTGEELKEDYKIKVFTLFRMELFC